jgi:hypothetical protein
VLVQRQLGFSWVLNSLDEPLEQLKDQCLLQVADHAFFVYRQSLHHHQNLDHLPALIYLMISR